MDFLAENNIQLMLLNDRIRNQKLKNTVIQIYGGLEKMEEKNEKSR